MNRSYHENRKAQPSAATRASFTAAAGALLLLAACASTKPDPAPHLQAAQQAIADAERAQATEHAAKELTEARVKLASANTAAEDKDMDQAIRMAEEARVDAELASARTAAKKAEAANEELKKSTDAMVEEMQRNTGASQ